MNAYKVVLLTFSLASLGLLGGGCGREAIGVKIAAHEKSEATTAPGITFSAKKGLLISPETAKFIGLQIVDVEERKIFATQQFSARVYRAASEARLASLQPNSAPGALASGNVSVADAAKLRESQTVSIRSDAGGVSLPGQIIALKHNNTQADAQVEVLLTIADAQPPLAAGAFVSVTVRLGGETPVASVPRAALIHTTEGDCVFTVNGEHFARTAVKLGPTDGEFTEVTDGLFAGDKVVARPVMTLWMTELHYVNGGDACCIAPVPGK